MLSENRPKGRLQNKAIGPFVVRGGIKMIILKILLLAGVILAILMFPCFVLAGRYDDASEEQLAELQRKHAQGQIGGEAEG